ncbi:MAG TPA: hypothetical protein DC024_10220 [Clostridiales bacterium]|jgi:hypothetical protein|nr:hypothetical protein [Clostridiales bacterium]
MVGFQQGDYYFGAALSLFLKHNLDSRPSLISDTDKKSQLIKLCTDQSNDFYIYMKFRSDYNPKTDSSDLTSWTFPLYEKDKQRIEKIINDGIPIFIFLICGYQNEETGEIAVLCKQDYDQIKNQDSVTLNLRGDRPKKFLIHTGRAQNKTFKIDRNRIQKNFQAMIR